MNMEKPILFSGSMVRAILEGRKTQTRRVIKPQPEWLIRGVLSWKGTSAVVQAHKAPYKKGDILWVRETFAKNIPGCPDGITYRADHQDQNGDGPANPIKWKPSIYMPRAASRITLEVIDVRIGRLQETTEMDARAEGVKIVGSSMGHIFTAREHFEGLWDSINKKRGFGWDVNPWVWAVSFKLVE